MKANRRRCFQHSGTSSLCSTNFSTVAGESQKRNECQTFTLSYGIYWICPEVMVMMIDRNLLQLKLNFNYASNSNSDIMTLLWNLCHQHNIKNYIKNEFIINFYIKMLYIQKIMGSTLTFEKIFECTEVFFNSDESLLR